MSKCYSCESEFTLKPEEIKCDSCGNIVNFPCHNCKEWFELPQKLCSVCGYYICPNCNTCGERCLKDNWKIIIIKIIPDISKEQIEKIINLIEDIKLNKDQKNCPRGVPISYAKGRIKNCIIRMRGYKTKDNEDMKKFASRYDNIMGVNIGTILTINQSREKGNYGQEFRDAFNFAICRGKLKKVKVEKIIDNEKVEFIGYKRIEEGDCLQLDLTKLIIKVCSNPKCFIKEFPLSQTHCCDPRCNYKKSSKKGQQRKLKLKISNKDICRLNRGDFSKEENATRKYN